MSNTKKQLNQVIQLVEGYSIDDLFQNVVIMARVAGSDQNPNDAIKAIAHVSPDFLASTKGKSELSAGFGSYKDSYGLYGLELYVFGGDGFVVQNMPYKGATYRVKQRLGNRSEVRFLEKVFGKKLTTPDPDMPPEVIKEVTGRMKTDPGLKSYPHNPLCMQRQLVIQPNSSYEYKVKMDQKIDTQWQMTFEEFMAMLQKGMGC